MAQVLDRCLKDGNQATEGTSMTETGRYLSQNPVQYWLNSMIKYWRWENNRYDENSVSRVDEEKLQRGLRD